MNEMAIKLLSVNKGKNKDNFLKNNGEKEGRSKTSENSQHYFAFWR